MKSRANWANRWMWQPITLAFDWMGRNIVFIAIALGGTALAWASVTYIYQIPGLIGDVLARLTKMDVASSGTNPEDIRNLAYAFATLTGALAVLATIPFQLIKVWINERTARTAEQGHITDRITAAVAGLGADKTVKQDGGTEVTQPNLEVRIGAIYALERIAQDSLRDHVQIMEILCAYIRENAPASGAKKRPKGENILKWSYFIPHPREDIQTALTIIGRRSKKQQRMEKDYRLDLRRTNLQRADLNGMNFNKARFDAAHLEGAALWFVGLESANLQFAYLESANLQFAHLEGAGLESAYLKDVGLMNAYLKGAVLRDTRLDDADLGDANLEKAVVHQTDLSHTDGLEQEQIDGMFGDGSVRLPDTLTRPSHWPKAELDIADFYKEWDKWKENPKAYTPPKE